MQSFCEGSALTRELLANKFTLFVVGQDQLESQLNNSTDWFRLHPHDDIALFVMFIKVNAEISVMHRIRQPEIVDASALPLALQEYSSLFDIMAEEDPGYRQVQILQDAGILPVEPLSQGRPRGVSQNIPQSVIDEMMQEHPEHNGGVPSNNDPPRPVEPEEVIQPRAPSTPPAAEKKAPEHERRVVTLPEEPGSSEADSLELVFRMPLSGERIRRRFLKTDPISLLYDFVDDLQNQGRCTFEGVAGYSPHYQIMQTMPRKVFSDKEASLESVGFFPRGAMLQV